ncbi:MAG TPA: glycogen-binding domain-containing protein [Gemmatimonadaceae bacterium]|nr:glycogen-binding domain-containing protein [Gemmatimonadaceae bacterium]
MLVLVVGASARGQVVSGTGLGTLLQRSPGSAWQPSSALWQSAQIDTRWTRLAGDGLLLGTGRGTLQLQDLAFDGSFSPSAAGRFRWSTSAELRGSRSWDGRSGLQSDRRIESALSIAALGGGAWVGGGAEQGREIDAGKVKPLLLLGLWRPFGRALVSVTSSTRRARFTEFSSSTRSVLVMQTAWDTVAGKLDTISSGTRLLTDSSANVRDLRWTEIDGRFAWASSRVAVDARLGVRPRMAGVAAGTWGRVTTTVAVAPRLALVAAAGNETALASSASMRSPFVSLGLRVAPAALSRPRPSAHVRPAASAFRMEPADSGRYRVTIHATSARTVELSGDFGGWRPVTLEQISPDVWEATLPLAPGTYHVNMRVNGDRWVAPPGLPVAEDEFNGTVGLLIVR